ncbi:MAG: HlyD family efflux transporter periplasmic adaptor subunit [Advenella sp.]|uniref:HlyD family secretion protein n=1 Tax=Advenella sp. TaxID=1872388 RepID=UPI0021B13A02|nr:HlyD family efflux transporter periplasmic adaptor subunit [Advenella sp.]MDD3759002.1 HlyD family efflux transporter periplasmic adaptor subunit [Advenella sp.]
MSASKKRTIYGVALVVVVAAIAYFLWQQMRPQHDEDFAYSNGRIEATEVDVSAKAAGRIREILVNEGDFVEADQLVARMDMESLQARLSQAEAELARAHSAKDTALALVAQREADLAMSKATLVQRNTELELAQKTHQRSQELVKQRATSVQQADNDRAQYRNAQAMVAVAEAQVAAVQAGIQAAKSQVAQADASILAAEAVIANLKSELKDGDLRAPRAGRVQYRVAQPGEVVGNGGKILSLVDVGDVYMTVFLPETQAGRVAMGAEARVIIDAIPQYVIPAEVSYVSSVAQFTPKMVETQDERQKLTFRVKVRIDPALLEKHMEQVKTGVPGVAYIRLDANREWPEHLQVKLP